MNWYVLGHVSVKVIFTPRSKAVVAFLSFLLSYTLLCVTLKPFLDSVCRESVKEQHIFKERGT